MDGNSETEDLEEKSLIEEFSKENKIVTLPNILSLFRICLIPVFILLYLQKETDIWAAMILILSGLTDLADGWIARHFNMVSTLGKALDPIADKLTQLSVLFCLVFKFPVMWIVLSVLIIKELFMGITSLLAIRKSGVVNGAKWHGKITTSLLYVMMFLHILCPNLSSEISVCLIVICVAMMLLSMVLYGMANIKTIVA